MPHLDNTITAAPQSALSDDISRNAEYLFRKKGMMCSTAVLASVSEGFGEQMPQELVQRLTVGLGEGMAESGCTCGALSGGVMALGLIIGKDQRRGRGKKLIYSATGQLHNTFKSQFGSTCCRVLTKKVKQGSREHFRQCAFQTAMSAQWCADLICRHRPELCQSKLPASEGYDRKTISFWARLAARLNPFSLRKAGA